MEGVSSAFAKCVRGFLPLCCVFEGRVYLPKGVSSAHRLVKGFTYLTELLNKSLIELSSIIGLLLEKIVKY